MHEPTRRGRAQRRRWPAFLLTALVMAGVGPAVTAPTPAAAQDRPGVPTGCIAPPDGLQGWWSFDGTSNDVTQTQPASSSAAPNPTLTSPVDGRVFGAAEFGGGAVVVDPVDLHLDQELSIDFWMKAEPGSDSVRTILDHRPTASATNTAGFAVFTYQSHLGFQVGNGTNSFTNVIPHDSDPTVPAVETGDWVFVAITLDAERQARFFVDGAEVATADLSAAAGGALSVPEPLYIGRRLDGTNAFLGALDEVEIFNRVLTDTEIVEIVELGKCRPPATCNRLPVTVNLNYGQVPTTGDDVILGTNGVDSINALSGDDVVCALNGDDLVSGARGNDVVFAGGGRDTVRGNGGDDRLLGQAQNDRLLGGPGADRILGQDGDDTVLAEGGQDVVSGGPGRDQLSGGADFDRISGDAGNDRLFGGDDRDWLSAGTGNDLLYGNNGDDRLRGNPGNDSLFGQAGVDQLYGGAGRDRLSGGPDRPDLCNGFEPTGTDGLGNDTADRTCEVVANL